MKTILKMQNADNITVELCGETVASPTLPAKGLEKVTFNFYTSDAHPDFMDLLSDGFYPARMIFLS